MSEEPSPFCSIEEAIEEIRAGRMVVVVDSPDRENEGDLCMAAEYVSAESINFMATHGRGLICLTLTPERCEELGLQMMVQHNQTPYETAFTVSIEAREGIETGISAQGPRAHDRGRLRDGHGSARHHQARSRVPAARAPRRRARAHGPDRGLGRSRAARRACARPASSARS